MPDQARCPVAELTPALRIEQTFMISQPQLRTTSRGDYYIAAFLSDSTGKLNGRMWQASQLIFDALPHEGFVWVRGRTENYQDSLQLVIEAVRPVDASEVDLKEFIPSTDKDATAMFARVRDILATIQDPHLAGLVNAFLADEALMGCFQEAPAAISMHHAYLGGLLEHTLGMLETATRVLPLYPELNADLVLASVFMHDIGKTSELAYDVSFHYSDRGQLVGHITMAAMLIREKLAALPADPPFPPTLQDRLLHIILAHHGQREYGCPVLPATPEAFFVHYLDNLDAKLALCREEIDRDSTPGPWTGYVRSIESRLFKPHAE